MLTEVPSPLGLLLFQRYRDVELWAAADVATRPRLFGHTLLSESAEWTNIADAPDPVAEPLRIFASVVHNENVSERAVADACLTLGEWALNNGYGRAEMLFATLAAAVLPDDPACTIAAGRAARRQSAYQAAEEWFRRTIALARRADQPQHYALAYLGWGLLEERRGRRERATSRFIKCYRAAMRAQLRTEAASARHAMVAIAARDGDYAAAQHHVVAAYKLYSSEDPWLPRLAVDAGALWTLQGFYDLSRKVYVAALPHLVRRADKLHVVANLARAAAALGDSGTFMRHWGELAPELETAEEHSPQMLLELAEGARMLNYHRKAHELAQEAERMAQRLQQMDVASDAKRLLHTLAEGHSGVAPRVPPLGLQRFARRFIRRVRADS